MYYKLRNDIIFRKYPKHGYITDVSEYRYFMLNDNRKRLGEKYVSASGAEMLSMLDKIPQSIDGIVEKLSEIFIGVDLETLKQDTIEFFELFVKEGYICQGRSADACIDSYVINTQNNEKLNLNQETSVSNACVGKEINSNEFLRSIHIDVADACNERCIHCYIPEDCKKNLIDPSLFYRIVENGLKMNIVHITLSGGEPLLHKDIKVFLKICREQGLAVNVLSNLTLLTDDIVSEMKKNPLLSVQVSLYSIDPFIHDSITQLKGSFEKTTASILKLCAEGIPVQISCPIIKQNKKSFDEVLHWGWNHNIGVVSEPQIFATYDHSKCNLDNRLSVDEVSEIIDLQMKEGFAQSIYEIAQNKELLDGNDSICSICRYSFCVKTDGKVFPCAGWQNNVVGDLNLQTVKEIWELSNEVQKLRRIKRSSFPQCVNCNDRGYCTVCMMWNSNENNDGDPYRINSYRCNIAALTHQKVEKALL